jgi:hypothetical protein
MVLDLLQAEQLEAQQVGLKCLYLVGGRRVHWYHGYHGFCVPWHACSRALCMCSRQFSRAVMKCQRSS